MPVEFLKDVAAALKPPPDGAPTPEYRWRTTVAYSIIVGYGVALLQAALIWGLLSTFGFSGFARADSVDRRFDQIAADKLAGQKVIEDVKSSMTQNTNAILARVISGQILSTYASECAARRSGNTALAANIDTQLSDLQVSYMSVSGTREYPLRPCP